MFKATLSFAFGYGVSHMTFVSFGITQLFPKEKQVKATFLLGNLEAVLQKTCSRHFGEEGSVFSASHYL